MENNKRHYCSDQYSAGSMLTEEQARKKDEYMIKNCTEEETVIYIKIDAVNTEDIQDTMDAHTST